MMFENILLSLTSSIKHFGKNRRNIILTGLIILIIGSIGTIATGSIVIREAGDYNLSTLENPQQGFFGISLYLFEYVFVFVAILGFFILVGGLVAMNSKKMSK